MGKSEVSLVLRVRGANGKRAHYTAVFTSRGAIKPHVGVVSGKEQHFPDAIYYLRYRVTEAGKPKRVWEGVGADPNMAVTARIKRAHQLEDERAGVEGSAGGRKALTPVLVAQAPPPADLALAAGIDAYIAFVPKKLSDHTTTTSLDEYTTHALKTAKTYRFRLEEFAAGCGAATLGQVKVDHVCDYILKLRASRKSTKTIVNRLTVLRSFLRWSKVSHAIVSEACELMRLVTPKYKAKVYTPEQVSQLLAVSSKRDQFIWSLFLATGLRDQELAYLAWDDVNFEEGLVHLHEKPDVDFTLKDREERQVPLPDDVIDGLKLLYGRRAGSRWVLPTVYGHPDLHFLRRLKRVAWRGGLNCGYCVSRPGVTCKDHPVCKKWQLHSLRRTAATRWVRSGLDPRTVQEWLGHSDLATTLKYLGSESLKEQSVRDKVNNAFSGKAMAA